MSEKEKKKNLVKLLKQFKWMYHVSGVFFIANKSSVIWTSNKNQKKKRKYYTEAKEKVTKKKIIAAHLLRSMHRVFYCDPAHHSTLFSGFHFLFVNFSSSLPITTIVLPFSLARMCMSFVTILWFIFVEQTVSNSENSVVCYEFVKCATVS